MLMSPRLMRRTTVSSGAWSGNGNASLTFAMLFSAFLDRASRFNVLMAISSSE